VENPTTNLTAKPDEKSPDEIEREMVQTRESITEKVSILESQVKGTIESVTGTVDAVKEAVTNAPEAVSETVKQTVAAVKEQVRSIDVAGFIRDNPWGAVGTSVLGGFLAGFFLLGGSKSRRTAPPVPGLSSASYQPAHDSGGILDDLFSLVGKEAREMAGMALASATEALKRNINTAVPGLIDRAVDQVTQANGTTGESRVHGPDYAAR
jgi:ElaB/YqjD/DUF883 family membrane-anchored ribosome-binding protein